MKVKSDVIVPGTLTIVSLNNCEAEYIDEMNSSAFDIELTELRNRHIKNKIMEEITKNKTPSSKYTIKRDRRVETVYQALRRDTNLNYMRQHAENIVDDLDKLEQIHDLPPVSSGTPMPPVKPPRNCEEGKQKKGGWNSKPTIPPPLTPPKGQSGSGLSEKRMRIKQILTRFGKFDLCDIEMAIDKIMAVGE